MKGQWDGTRCASAAYYSVDQRSKEKLAIGSVQLARTPVLCCFAKRTPPGSDADAPLPGGVDHKCRAKQVGYADSPW